MNQKRGLNLVGRIFLSLATDNRLFNRRFMVA